MTIALNLTSEHAHYFRKTPVLVEDYTHFTRLVQSGFMPYIELRSFVGGSSKFWRIEKDRWHGVIRRWGRIGTNGQSKGFGDKSALQLLIEKLNKGYGQLKTGGHIPARITEVRSNGDLVELVATGNVVWSDTPSKALQVLASCY